MPGNVLKLRKLHPAQKYIGRHSRRFNNIACGRRFGKTDFGLARLALAPKSVLQGHPVGWFAPNYKYLDDPWRMAKRLFRPMIASADKTARRIELLNGGMIDFWTLDDPDAGRSRKYAHVIVDEAGMVKELKNIWELSIRPTLSDLQGTGDFLSTPKGLNAFYDLHQLGLPDNPERGHVRDPEWASFQFPTSSNPHIHPGEIASAKRMLPELVFAQEYLAKFVDFGGTAIKRAWLKNGDVFARWPLDQLRIGMGVDLAISLKTSADYSALVVVALDPEGGIWVVFARRERMTFHQTMQAIVETARRWHVQRTLVEQVQYQAAVVQELLRTTDLNVQGFIPDKDKLTRFQPLQTRYEQGLVTHAFTLPPTFEAELLGFPPQTQAEHDDQVDALGLAWRAAAGYELGQTVDSVGDRVSTGTAAVIESADDWGTVQVMAPQGY
jgi:predicted phage terminase large subunit-like protein